MGYVQNLIVTVSLVLVPVFSANPTEIIVNQSSPVATSTPVELAVVRQVKRPEPSATQIALINAKADQFNVSAEVMTKVIACESGFNERALGDYGYSRGLVQIHSKYHPDVTDEQAYDAEFAVEFLAQKLSEGKGSLWTCYRLLAKSG